ncbi:MAG: hypothetical protein LUQ55_00510, partial [Methanomassiliicoccales archaeon]|nr:hypothetical protein [Methanomassiliicoccales archaeon]
MRPANSVRDYDSRHASETPASESRVHWAFEESSKLQTVPFDSMRTFLSFEEADYLEKLRRSS